MEFEGHVAHSGRGVHWTAGTSYWEFEFIWHAFSSH